MADLVERLVPDELWELFRRMAPSTEVIRPQGGGRRWAGDRETLAAIIFVATPGDVTAADRQKKRKDYLRMLEDVKSGHIDAIVGWYPDRLYRQPWAARALSGEAVQPGPGRPGERREDHDGRRVHLPGHASPAHVLPDHGPQGAQGREQGAGSLAEDHRPRGRRRSPGPAEERSEEFKAEFGERDATALKYPLIGLPRCTCKVPHVVGGPCSCKEEGRQHHKMSTGQRGDKDMPIYTCKKEGGGCGGRTMQIPDLEPLVEKLLFKRLEEIEAAEEENPDDPRPELADELLDGDRSAREIGGSGRTTRSPGSSPFTGG